MHTSWIEYVSRYSIKSNEHEAFIFNISTIITIFIDKNRPDDFIFLENVSNYSNIADEYILSWWYINSRFENNS